MATARIIKRRIRSAKNISQITRAMQMVAASKMKKATDQAIMGKPYMDKIYEMTVSFAKQTDPKEHPLLKRTGTGVNAVILVSTNKGLCGGLNASLFRAVTRWLPEKDNMQFVTVGRKGKTFIVRTDRKLIADFSEDYPFTRNISPITKLVVDGFLENDFKTVTLVYNEFISALKQIPRRKSLLPIGDTSLIQEHVSEESKEEQVSFNLLVEPSLKEVLNTLLYYYLENQIRDIIIQSEASEHSARMIAMKNATENAKDLTGSLTLVYNKIRQQGITTEISDMVTARSAVEAM